MSDCGTSHLNPASGSRSRLPQCIFILGPTATGKSDLAFELAQKLDCPILNVDSVQVYKELKIGSALPPDWQFQKIEHQLFACVDPGEELTAGQFRKMALERLKNNFEQGHKHTVLVGGSGFYVRALLKGMYDLKPLDEATRSEIQGLSREEAFAKLKVIDRKSAERISENDEYRIKRALEICASEGLPASKVQDEFAAKDQSFPFAYKLFGINALREELRPRVQKRTQQMIDQGLLEETKKLLDLGFAGWRPLSSVGYKEACSCLNGEINEDQLAEEITKNTMKLIKKQSTFFRGQFEISWLQWPVCFEDFWKIDCVLT